MPKPSTKGAPTPKAPTSQPFTLTPEQELAVAAAADPTTPSIMLNAYAGTAKTTTLRLMAHAQLRPSSALALAFNKKVSTDLAAALPLWYEVRSFNALGHRAWGAKIGHLTLDERKLGRITTQFFRASGKEWPEDAWDSVRQLVSEAMNAGLKPSSFPGPAGLLPDTWESWVDLADNAFIPPDPDYISLAREILDYHISEGLSGLISYDDQIYLPTLFGGLFPRVSQVIVDEYQDLNPLNILMLRKVAGGRIWCAGDRLQSIYRFRGADDQAQSKIRALKPDWLDLSLTLTFRCPRAVVDRQQSHAIGFTAAPANPEGQVTLLRPPLDSGPWSWSWSQIPEGEVTVLCRANAPLLKLALKLLRQGIGIKMMKRDLGKSLLALSKKLFPVDSTPIPQCLTQVDTWREKETQAISARGHGDKIGVIDDRAECLLAILESPEVTCAGDFRKRLEFLFSQTHALVTLSTIHGFKGLECPTILHLDHWRTPSRKALAAGGPELQQELNLKYVAETRTQSHLILASLEDFT